MKTIYSPKCLSDLRYEDHVLTVSDHFRRSVVARKYFKEIFDTDQAPTHRLIFKENGYEVFEVYVDPGSEDYLYIIVK